MLYLYVLFGNAAFIVAAQSAAYILTDSFAGKNFFPQFNFYSDADPTRGFVNYVDQTTAQAQNLVGIGNDGAAFIRADSWNSETTGRKSVRIYSKKSYKNGLIIADFGEMPGSVCGSWPAFWMFGPDWPNSGEIDIIEGVNDATNSGVTLHTAEGCSIDGNAGFSGSVQSWNCFVNAPGQAANAGCRIGIADTTSYGDGFNAAGGGVYAVEISDQRIAAWFFSRKDIPGDIPGGTPDPSTWGKPVALFSSTTCNISQLFKNLNIVLNITFCGDWAGSVWDSSSCATKAATCQEFVEKNPSAFAKSQWKINYINFYKNF